MTCILTTPRHEQNESEFCFAIPRRDHGALGERVLDRLGHALFRFRSVVHFFMSTAELVLWALALTID